MLIAMKAPDTFGGLIATGITSLVAIQVILNIAVVTSSMPNTGIPLPFFSYGGTALFILLSSVRYLTKYFKSWQKSLTILGTVPKSEKRSFGDRSAILILRRKK